MYKRQLLVPAEGSLSSIARQRLAALKEFSELGAGFRIAALDLELRGAGNLLGREQHGHVGAVGFDLYCRMLERAVAQRKGEEVAPELHTTLTVSYTHLDVYKRQTKSLSKRCLNFFVTPATNVESWLIPRDSLPSAAAL